VRTMDSKTFAQTILDWAHTLPATQRRQVSIEARGWAQVAHGGHLGMPPLTHITSEACEEIALRLETNR
jgi:hypothetical protein